MSCETDSPSGPSRRETLLGRFAGHAAQWTGGSTAFTLAVLILLLWAASRPIFDSFDSWQLVINTGTTIITFLMVFLIQRAQNKDSKAIHLKLNEVVAALEGASNRLINVEDLTEDEVRTLHEHYCTLVKLAKKSGSLKDSHSIEDATERHEKKQKSLTGEVPAVKS